MIEIKNRWNQSVVYKSEVATTLAEAVLEAVQAGASLNDAELSYLVMPDRARLVGASLDRASLVGASLDGASLVGASLVGASLDRASLDRASLVGASLDGASLVGASLDGASLDGASLDRARLVGASLDRASLVGASLDGASLVGASLDGASLDGASLVGASLDGASLVGASLDGASLDRARLVGASLDPIRDDFWKVLDAAPREVRALLATLRMGKVNGSTYQGACACLVGTIANVRGCSHNALGNLLPDAGRPAERWFLAIHPGHTPENHEVARITEQWTLAWLEKNQPESADTVAADAEAAVILQHFIKRRHEMFGAGDVEGLKALRGELERRTNA